MLAVARLTTVVAAGATLWLPGNLLFPGLFDILDVFDVQHLQFQSQLSPHEVSGGVLKWCGPHLSGCFYTCGLFVVYLKDKL